MASIKIQSSSSGGGSITLTAPTTSSNRTVTLPDEDVTLVGGAITHLGTLSPTASSTSLTLSSLTLTSYKFLFINFDRLLGSSDSGWYGINGANEYNAVGKMGTGAGSATYGDCFFTITDLATDVTHSTQVGTQRDNGSNFLWMSNEDTYTGGHKDFGLTTSTTSISIQTRSGYSFFATQGSIRFYGVA